MIELLQNSVNLINYFIKCNNYIQCLDTLWLDIMWLTYDLIALEKHKDDDKYCYYHYYHYY